MLRTTFVLLIIAIGMPIALRDAFGALLLYLFVAYFRPDYWVWNISFIRSLNLSLISGVYLLARALLSGTRLRFDLRSTLLFLFVALSLISTMTSTRDDYAFPFFINFAKTIIVSYLISVLITNLVQFRTVVIVMCYSLCFDAARQGWARLILNPGGRNDNSMIMLGDNNAVAVGLMMMVPLFIALARTSQERWERWLHYFMMVGVAYRAISTYSRGGFLAAAAVLLIYIARSERKLRSTVAAVIVAGALLSVLPSGFWDRMSTIPTSQEMVEEVAEDSTETDGSMRGRLHFWRVAIDMAVANPIFGVGLNAYSRLYNQYDFSGGQYGRRRSVHSLWFGILAELGIPAFLLFLLMLGLAIGACGGVARQSLRGELPRDFHYFAVAAQTGFGALIVGGTFLPFQYVEILWHFVGLSMALRAVAMETATAALPSQADPYSAQISSGFQPAPTASGT
jgi:probable O-glycosylation ligase (exosortase A-associated)